ncbi:ribosome hibernation-promoting factor, HPF/YfiA family [Nitrosomonas sp. Nm58]|jgi:ribosomal subunit interface protein|uniref:ribosome hibernation-promoting factor, HPF/YfiA family n=1 Tax=Nitrosomonas sp. Nm58 TaxID=200126 RepID=UPI000895BF25|nr:ribosome-associated translation inhibitor RaiA [Nitrosomonas sp. Nm58]SDY82672.1 ribosomal subunit interface protein [Nitrosomonas sp. Nm58]
MQSPLQITIRDISASDALEAHIRDKVEKLESYFDRLVSCHVVVEMPHKHHQQGKEFNVRINIGVPGSDIVVNRDHHEDPYVALRDAFDAAKRQLEDYARRMQLKTKTHVIDHIGQVTRIFYEEGYGFITGQDSVERYFHRDNVIDPSFDRLQEGDEVKFIEEMGAEGPQAKRVSAGKHHLPE